MSTTRALKFWAVAAAAAALTAACSSSGGGGNSSSAASKPAAASAPAASTVTIKLSGNRLVGSNGHTLYYNTVDTADKVDCVGGCAATWPPVTGTAKAGTGLDATNLATITRPDGSTQVTFFGHPLYEFSGDTAGADTKGSGIADGGGKWIVANPQQAANGGGSSGSDDGSTAPSAPKSSAPGNGGGGYTY